MLRNLILIKTRSFTNTFQPQIRDHESKQERLCLLRDYKSAGLDTKVKDEFRYPYHKHTKITSRFNPGNENATCEVFFFPPLHNRKINPNTEVIRTPIFDSKIRGTNSLIPNEKTISLKRKRFSLYRALL